MCHDILEKQADIFIKAPNTKKMDIDIQNLNNMESEMIQFSLVPECSVRFLIHGKCCKAFSRAQPHPSVLSGNKLTSASELNYIYSLYKNSVIFIQV